ncbi:hypothetical protein [Macrococcoides caseolyticum]|uniref:hypothetical protein n=1 Tax=Macrococcoides caseolyticum TaxID=69966 RepID=UPI001F16B813|nr:hypothetical protein [Macrococcus caseolyticus]MCE4957073.1 hypothetical protein [Macrococcus caseolyticus]
MTFYERFLNDINMLHRRYPYFEMIDVDEAILKQTECLQVDDQTKCAILAIDTSMRMQDLVNDINKDRYVLSTDLLSALFYRYLATPFSQKHYQLLTACVAEQNELKQVYADTKDEQLLDKINNIFVAPFKGK